MGGLGGGAGGASVSGRAVSNPSLPLVGGADSARVMRAGLLPLLLLVPPLESIVIVLGILHF